MKLITLTLIISNCFWSLCQETENWNFLSTKTYSIEYPENWNIDTSGLVGTKFFISSPLLSPDRFTDHVNLIVEELPNQNTDLDEFMKITGELIQQVSGAHLLKSTREVRNGIEFHRVLFKLDKGYFNFEVLFERYYWVKNGHAYTLSFVCELDQYENYKDLGQRILNSFLLK